MKAFDRLLKHQIKPSVQRLAIMEYLITHYTHPTAEEIYTALSPTMPTLSKTTVYNTLNLFSEHGAAQMLTIDEKNVCFDANLTPHAHFLCKKCGKIYDVSMTNEAENSETFNRNGHEITETHYYYKGVCRNCL